jgi:hypothetical protein
MKPAHTPGPWLAWDLNSKTDVDRTIEARIGPHNNPRYIARVYGQGVLSKPDPESLANARLIAAAPAMYAALAGCIDELELHEKAARTDGDADLLRRLDEARAALAAADKGEA